MNVEALTLEHQPAVIDGIEIVSRKVWVCRTPVTLDQQLVPTLGEGKTRKYYVDHETLFPSTERLEMEAITNSKPDANILNLRMIAFANGITTVDGLVDHLDNPPRFYPAL